MGELLQRSLALWRQDGLCLPPFDRTFTPAEQAEREIHLHRFLQIIEAASRDLPRARSGRRSARSRITRAFRDFAKACLDLEDRHLELLVNDGFSTIATQLARGARQVDPAVTFADIFQASRNAWTACGLQTLLGQEMRLTPSIFAYSMLYPYTDNYLDDPASSLEAKLAFSERLRYRLEGCLVAPLSDREATIWRLLEFIEGQYPRAEWPEVYASLLAIHRAQEDSVRFLRGGPRRAEVDVLNFSFQKGGVSVLSDAYLAAGSLSSQEAQLAFDWGVVLQLADDLQDLRTDLRDGILTVFTQSILGDRSETPCRVRLDDLTTRTFRFADQVMRKVNRMTAIPRALNEVKGNRGRPPGVAGDFLPPARSAVDSSTAKRKSLTEMMRMSCSLLLIWSAAESPQFYGGDYLAKLESHSPFRFAPLAERRKKLGRRNRLVTRLFESFLENEDNEGKESASFLVASFLVPRL